MALLVLMLGLTFYAQYGIIPAMERDRIAAGGAIDRVPADDPNRMHFNKLHNRSESVEIGVLLLGILVVALCGKGRDDTSLNRKGLRDKDKEIFFGVSSVRTRKSPMSFSGFRIHIIF